MSLQSLAVASPAYELSITRLIDAPCARVFRAWTRAELLSNLVANAIHHGSKEGPVIIEADVEDGIFRLSVHNQGTPISAPVLAQLFQPFTRHNADAPPSGLGLGLYIADQIARAHGGHMEVSSTAETGTLFTFRLALKPK